MWLTALGHALAAIVLLLLIIGAVLLCTICHCMATRQLQTPAVKPSGHRRYKGMKEFENAGAQEPYLGHALKTTCPGSKYFISAAPQHIPQCITCPSETARQLHLQAPAATCLDKITCCKRMNEVNMPELKHPPEAHSKHCSDIFDADSTRALAKKAHTMLLQSLPSCIIEWGCLDCGALH